MSPASATFLTWSPRILALLYAIFISVFALDSQEAHHDMEQIAWHVFLHLIPAAAVLLVLFLAWHKRILGGLAFMVLGMIFTIQFGTWRKTDLFLLFSVPLFLVGMGFIFSRYAQLGGRKR